MRVDQLGNFGYPQVGFLDFQDLIDHAFADPDPEERDVSPFPIESPGDGSQSMCRIGFELIHRARRRPRSGSTSVGEATTTL
ncbi:MAG: hypothetical protein ABSG65_29225 [Bryobacteraceae bacterium]|jgi:hypothetical protein